MIRVYSIPLLSDLTGMVSLTLRVGSAVVDPVQRLPHLEGAVGGCLGPCRVGWAEVGIAYCCGVAAVFFDQIVSRLALHRLSDVVGVVHAPGVVDKTGTVLVVPGEETMAGKLRHFLFLLAAVVVSVLAAVKMLELAIPILTVPAPDEAPCDVAAVVVAWMRDDRIGQSRPY